MDKQNRYEVKHKLKCFVCKSLYVPGHATRYTQKYCGQKCRSRAAYLGRKFGVDVDSTLMYDALEDCNEWLRRNWYMHTVGILGCQSWEFFDDLIDYKTEVEVRRLLIVQYNKLANICERDYSDVDGRYLMIAVRLYMYWAVHSGHEITDDPEYQYYARMVSGFKDILDNQLYANKHKSRIVKVSGEETVLYSQ